MSMYTHLHFILEHPQSISSTKAVDQDSHSYETTGEFIVSFLRS